MRLRIGCRIALTKQTGLRSCRKSRRLVGVSASSAHANTRARATHRGTRDSAVDTHTINTETPSVLSLELEVDQAEVLHLIESADALKAKVQEALAVLAAAE